MLLENIRVIMVKFLTQIIFIVKNNLTNNNFSRRGFGFHWGCIFSLFWLRQPVQLECIKNWFAASSCAEKKTLFMLERQSPWPQKKGIFSPGFLEIQTSYCNKLSYYLWLGICHTTFFKTAMRRCEKIMYGFLTLWCKFKDKPWNDRLNYAKFFFL